MSEQDDGKTIYHSVSHETIKQGRPTIDYHIGSLDYAAISLRQGDYLTGESRPTEVLARMWHGDELHLLLNDGVGYTVPDDMIVSWVRQVQAKEGKSDE